MQDQHEAHSDRNDFGQDLHRSADTRDGAMDRTIADRPLADREVPLPGMAAADDPTMVAIHQWLDGDLSEVDARRADTKQVDMWTKIAGETEQRRRMVTPTYVAANIMAALPEKQLAKSTATATNAMVAPARGMSMTAVVAIGAGMLAIGVALGKLVL